MDLYMKFPEIISDTDVSLFGCPLKWFRERCLCLKPLQYEYNENLTAGVAFAKGLELTRLHYIETGNVEEALEKGKTHILELMETEEEEDSLFGKRNLGYKTPIRVSQLLEEYLRQFPLDQEYSPVPLTIDGNKGIEHTITAELPLKHPITDKPLIFKGKFDMLGKTEMGTLAIFDEKVVKNLTKNDQKFYSVKSQFIGYSWLCQQEGYGDVNNVYVRACAILKNEYKIAEYPIYITESMRKAWLSNLLETSLRFKSYFKVQSKNSTYFNPSFSSECNKYFTPCQYTNLCTGEDTETEYKQITWDKDTRKEIPLVDYKLAKTMPEN